MSKAFRAAFQPGCSQPSLRGRLIEFQDHLSVLVFNLHTDPRVEFGCLVRGRDVGDVDDIDTALPARSRAAAASSALSAVGEQSYPVSRCRLGLAAHRRPPRGWLSAISGMTASVAAARMSGNHVV